MDLCVEGSVCDRCGIDISSLRDDLAQCPNCSATFLNFGEYFSGLDEFYYDEHEGVEPSSEFLDWRSY